MIDVYWVSVNYHLFTTSTWNNGHEGLHISTQILQRSAAADLGEVVSFVLRLSVATDVFVLQY